MEENIRWGISGSKERIFVSTAFGCNYNCRYCYLKDMNIQGIQQHFKKEELLKQLNCKRMFVPGKRGSIITIGCFTECWDEINRETTIHIINYFLRHNNYIQISTKKKILDKDMASIIPNIRFENQINIFVSLPTLSYAKEFEPDVDSPVLRSENLDIKRKYGINTYLYIKPVIESVTIKDKEKYRKLIEQYQIPAVIGEMMHPTYENDKKNFLLGNIYMKEDFSNDSDELVDFLGKYTKVYRHSDEAIKRLRREYYENSVNEYAK